MYKILVADDEAAILERIAKTIAWKEAGCEVVATAQNGQEAFDKIIEFSPDIVITDIRMPVCSGIDLMKKLIDNNVQTSVIFLSGYGDFEYVQTALRLGAADYLLKPAEEEEILEVVKKTIGKIEQGKSNKKQLSDYNDNLPKLKEKFYLTLLNGQASRVFFDEQVALFNLDIAEKNHIVFIIHIDVADMAAGGSGDRQLLEYGISNIVGEIIAKLGQVMVIIDTGGDILAVLSSQIEPSVLNKRLEAVCTGIKNIVNKVYDETVSIGIGDVQNDLFNIKRSFDTAKENLSLKDFLGDNKIYAKQEKPDSDVNFMKSYDLEELLTGIRLADREKTLLAIDRIIADITQKNNLTPLDLRVVYFDIMFSVLKNISQSRLFSEDVKFFDVRFFSRVNSLKRVEQLSECLKEYMLQLIPYLENINSGNKRKIVDLAIEYINKNYQKQISLQDVTDEIYLNPSYFCKVFKNETGQTFKQYLMKYRIDKAKILLGDPRKKVYEVAEEVGYTDVQYFTKIFKALTGVLPTQFRELNK